MATNYRYQASQEQLMAPPNMMSPPYPAYRTLGTPTITSPLQRPTQLTPNGNRYPGSPPVQHMRQPSQRSVQSSPKPIHIGTPQSAVGRAAFSMSPPPLPHAAAIARMQRSQKTPTGRRLPSTNITKDNIENAYVTFILYANPSIPASTDTAELRKTFRLLPKSDGKSFDIFTLWELIRKLESGELKTWVQLALELGVVPPLTDRGQSTQKIQQYAVRLKRWMHAMHVDAFFEYCLGKPHVYYSQIPTGPLDETPEPRDGVPPEEDLAIRALIPGFKPKRGRKKANEREGTETPERPVKRPHLEISPQMLEYQGLESTSMFPQGAMTWSAFPDDPEGQDPWGHAGLAITSTENASQGSGPIGGGLSEQRWHRAVSPSAYPQSAIEPSYSIEDAFDVPEPRSAIAPNSSAKTGKSRRRNQPTISSAWLPSGASTNARPRGRPSQSRTSQEGPYGTFSINEKGTSNDEKPRASRTPKPPSRPPSTSTSVRSMQIHAPVPQGRPARLQLQVPQHIGGPIRLATPPNMALNVPLQGGRTSADFFRPPSGAESIHSYDADAEPDTEEQPPPPFDLALSDVANAFAARILHGKLVGRQGSLTLEEATLISNKAIAQLRHDCPSDLPPESFAIRCATALGVSSDLGIGSGAASIITVKSVPQPLNGSLMGRARSRGSFGNGRLSRDGLEYVLTFDVVYGAGISSSVQIQNIFVPLHLNSEGFEREIRALRTAMESSESEIGSFERNVADQIMSQEERTWKEKCLELQKELAKRDELLKRMKRRVFEVVMSGDT